MTEPPTEPRAEMRYGDYLELDQLLSAQRPRTDSSDELLFIVIHQAAELWIKLALRELTESRDKLAADAVGPAIKHMARVARIFQQLIQSWDVLATLTPPEYLAFRNRLGTSSGFQSHQYRLLEFILGNRRGDTLTVHRARPDLLELLESARQAPSLYDEAVALLARRGFLTPANLGGWQQRGDGDSATRVADAAVTQAWVDVYRASEHHWDCYELAEKLVDIDHAFQRWRFDHLTTVQRMIGAKAGTGGSAGVPYLRRVADTLLFPELWAARTVL